MSLVAKTNPVGVDVAIDKLQRDLYEGLTVGFGWTGYEAYHRAYKNYNKGQIIPEIYTGANEYKDVLFDDTKNVSSFIIINDERPFTPNLSKFTVNLAVIFQAKLDKLFPVITHRADEELIDNVYKTIKNKRWDKELLGVVTGIKRVYDSLNIVNPKLPTDDTSNFFVVRFNFRVVYINTKCQTTQL